MKYQCISVIQRPDQIGIITLNRPEKRNALSIATREEISACLDEWYNAPEVRAVIITNEGSCFSGGFDLKEFAESEKFHKIFKSSSRFHRNLWNFPKPVIAAIHGPALGGGFDLTTLCDIRICSDEALFGHPEIKFGAPPLYTPLRWIIGAGIARDLCFSGRRINATEALSLGLVSEVVPGDKLLEHAIERAKNILEAPAETLRIFKDYASANSGLGFEESFVAEHDEPFKQFLEKAAK